MIGLAMLASLMLHALLFFALPQLRDAGHRNAMPPGPLIARLAPLHTLAAPGPAVEKTPQPLRASPPQPAASVSRKQSAAPRPAPTEVPAPAAIVAQSPAPKANASATETSTATERAAASPSASPSSAAPSAPGSGSAGLLAKVAPQPAARSAPIDTAEPVSVNQYRLTVIGAAKRYKRYPRAAMDNNWEGRVVVHMVIGANGLITSLGVKTGTGHEILDREAVEMIRKAKPLAPIPAALRGKEFAVEIPVEFSLKEQG